jgi:hypothetical protein
MLIAAVHLPAGEPRLDLLVGREANEAYLNASPSRHYVVYFPNGGEVELAMPGESGKWRLRWLDVMGSRWIDRGAVAAGNMTLAAPAAGHWTAVLTPVTASR